MIKQLKMHRNKVCHVLAGYDERRIKKAKGGYKLEVTVHS
jgi:hypothetical protein